MSEKENDRIELDANPYPGSNDTDLVEQANESNSVEVYSNAVNNNTAIGTVVNNNMQVNNRNTSSTNITFEGCNAITLGNIVNVGPQWPQTITTVAEIPHELDESIIYKKTPTIKAMMESNQRLNDKYLDIFSVKLGHKYQALSVHLKIEELEVQKAMEDHKQYGTSEVLFQILSKYFQINDQYASVGWLTRFLWKNNYKQNVWAVKGLWKLLKELDEEAA